MIALNNNAMLNKINSLTVDACVCIVCVCIVDVRWSSIIFSGSIFRLLNMLKANTYEYGLITCEIFYSIIPITIIINILNY